MNAIPTPGFAANAAYLEQGKYVTDVNQGDFTAKSRTANWACFMLVQAGHEQGQLSRVSLEYID